MPRTVQQAPALQAPEGSLQSSQLLGAGIAGLGGAIGQAGETEQRRQDVIARRQHADAVIAGHLRQQETVPDLQTLYATEEAEQDYTTFGARVLEKGRQLITERGADLSPEAGQIYQTRILDNLNVLHQRALGEQSKRQDQAKAFAITQGIQQAEATMYSSTDPYERIVARGHRDSLLQDFVDAGLGYGAAMAAQLQASDEKIAVQESQRWIQRSPDAMLNHLYAVNRGDKGDPSLPMPPMNHIVPLIREAEQKVQLRLQQAEHDEKYTLWRSDQESQARTMYYREQISQLDPSPANIARFRELLTLANSPEQQQMLGPRGHQEVTTLLRGTINMALAATTPKVTDDPAIEQDMNLRIMLAKTPEQLYAAEQYFVTQGYQGLTPETQRTVHGLLRQRLDQTSPMNRPKYRDGIDYISRAEIMPPSLGAGVPLDSQRKAEVQKNLLAALDQFDREYKAVLNTTGVDEADRQASGLAATIRQAYFPAKLDTMPIPVRDARSIAEMRSHLDRLAGEGLAWPILQEYDRLWREGFANRQLPWQKALPPTAPPVAPGPPPKGRGGQQLP